MGKYENEKKEQDDENEQKEQEDENEKKEQDDKNDKNETNEEKKKEDESKSSHNFIIYISVGLASLIIIIIIIFIIKRISKSQIKNLYYSSLERQQQNLVPIENY